MEDRFKAALAAQLRAEMAARCVTVEDLAARCAVNARTVTQARKGEASSDAYRKMAIGLGVSFAAWTKRAEEDAR